MVHKKNKHYTAEFKTQVVELLSTGKPVSEVAEEMCIGSSLLYRWRQEHKGSGVGSAGLRAVGEQDQADDSRSLRKENEILKKAAIILGTRARSSSER